MTDIVHKTKFEMPESLSVKLELVRTSLQGWCSVEKSDRFVEVIVEQRPNLCVEIGVFGGSSLIPQGLALKENKNGVIFGIDPWETDAALEEMIDESNRQWWTDLNLESIYKGCLKQINVCGLGDYCKVIRDKSENVVDRFKEESIDVLHIDGNHSEALSWKDATLYLPKVKPEGIIFFDDIWWTEGENDVTTRKAILYLLEYCKKIKLCPQR